jgi:hypothetical protein
MSQSKCTILVPIEQWPFFYTSELIKIRRRGIRLFESHR